MSFLPMIPAEAVQIGTSCFAVVFGDERVEYYANLEPLDFHRIDERNAMLMRVGRFSALNGIKTGHLMAVFNLSRSTVERARKRFVESGEASFFAPRKGRGLSALTPERAERATRLLAEGLSGRAVADALDVSAASVYNWINKGLIGSRQNRNDDSATPEPVEAASDRSARDRRDRQAAMGRATCDTIGRVLASIGQAGPVMPRFEAARGVPCGGVLTALPALLREGLLSATELLSPLPRGYYAPATVFLCIAFMFMARVRTPESLRYHAPGEWGALLGHDRAPEAKTLRTKIGLIAGDETRVRAWQSALASRWQAGDPDSWATLCVDGHVKVYAGRKGRLPKHFVARQKLCLPASTSYWVNALGGQPLLCLHKPLDPKMVRALEHDVVPALDRLGVLDRARPDTPAVTLVFDREGWSPALFRRLARRGVAVLTWHKNFKGEDWPQADFQEVAVPIHGPATTRSSTVRLAEKTVTLAGDVTVRQIRRLLDTGRQVPFITTDFERPMAELAGAMFSRWAQENVFKYMRQQFGLDALPTRDLEELDPETSVVNPRRRLYEQAKRTLAGKLARLRATLAQLRARKKPAQEIKAEIKDLEGALDIIRTVARTESTHCRAGDLSEIERLDVLPSRERLFLDVIRMLAFRAETRMTLPIIHAQGRKPNPRKLLQAVMTADADILPDPANRVLEVRLLGLGADAQDRHIAPLLDELNATETIYPGTDLRMLYTSSATDGSPKSASSQI